MKKFKNKIIVLLLQLLLFYAVPLLAGPADTMGLVFFLLPATLVLSVFLGAVSDEKRKYLYPILIAVLFMPSVFLMPIYNQNTDALIYAIWYFSASAVGVLLGTVLRKITAKPTENK